MAGASDILGYMSEVESAIYKQESIAANIDSIKSKLEELKFQQSEAGNVLNEILNRSEDYGLTKKNVRSAAEERVQTLIGNGLLVLGDVEEAVDAPVVSVKKTRASKASKKKLEEGVSEVIEVVAPVAPVVSIVETLVQEPVVEHSEVLNNGETILTETLEEAIVPHTSTVDTVESSLPEVSEEVVSVGEDLDKETAIETPLKARAVPSFLKRQ